MQPGTTKDTVPATAGLDGAVYGPAWRLVIALLLIVSRGSLPFIMALVVFATDPPVTPPVLFRLVVVLAALPGIAAWLLGTAFAARIKVGATHLVAHGRGRRVEIPREAIAAAVPWRLPLPAPGVWLRLRSGSRLAVTVAEPGALLARLGRDAERRHPTVVYAQARARRPPTRWYHPLAKFILFGLAPAAVLFRAHQWIAYGGTFGQYYLLGLEAYLVTFAVYWATVTIYLVLWASLWRGLGEGAALLVAHVAPDRASSVRGAVEMACALLYYGGVPLLLLLRFLP